MTNLRRTRGIIMKIRSRDRTGKMIHKSEFSIDDPKAITQELKLWRDKFGVSSQTFKVVMNGEFDHEEYNNVRGMMEESIKESQEKVKIAMSN